MAGRGGACGGLEKRREKCVGRAVGPVRATCLAPSAGHSVGAHHGGGAGPWQWLERRRAARKQIQRLAVRTRIRRGQRGERVFAGVSCRQRATKTTTVLLFCSGQETAWCGSPICVSCLDDYRPLVLLKTVPLFVVCFFPSVDAQLGARPAAATRGAGLARAPLFVATGSVCRKAGWRLSIG